MVVMAAVWTRRDRIVTDLTEFRERKEAALLGLLSVGERWLEARAGRQQLAELDAEMATAERNFRKAERKLRREEKKLRKQLKEAN